MELTACKVSLVVPQASVSVVNVHLPVAGDGIVTELGRDADGELSRERSRIRSREVHVVLFRERWREMCRAFGVGNDKTPYAGFSI